jgi:zinc transport system substrate-binding protein
VRQSRIETALKQGKITVVTTLFPFYDFAKNVGGDYADVTLLLPPGVEAHSFEPKPSDIVRINTADIFIYTGKFMEPWAEDVIRSIGKNGASIVNASDNIVMMPGVFHDTDEPAGSLDPHIWLDFENDQKIIFAIANVFEERDPAHAGYYHENALRYNEELVALDMKYRLSLKECVSREIVYGGHYAFGYLAKRYNLAYLAAQGVSPDAEPTAQDLIALVEQIKKDNIHSVFYEELSSPKIAETIAGETKTQLLLLNAAHNIIKEDFQKGISFLAIMEENRQNLAKGLQCKEK